MYADTEMIIKDCIIYEKNTIINAKKKKQTCLWSNVSFGECGYNRGLLKIWQTF